MNQWSGTLKPLSTMYPRKTTISPVFGDRNLSLTACLQQEMAINAKKPCSTRSRMFSYVVMDGSHGESGPSPHFEA